MTATEQAIGACPCAGCGNHTAGITPYWPTRTGPLRALAVRDGHADELRYGWHPNWIDHSYRYRDHTGAMTYIAEPYDVGEDTLADLAWLSQHGWTVAVSGAAARHYPGHTVAIVITEPTDYLETR